MYHRYGRHGPHAWYQRRQRRFRRDLPVLAPQVFVVRVHIPIVVERIIFIVEDPNNQGSGPFSFEGNLLRAGADPFHYPRLVAKIEAQNQAEDDFANEGGSPPESLIREKARQSWRKNASSPKILEATNDQIDISDVRDAYITTYVAEYQTTMSKEYAAIPDETIYAIERLARTDRELDGGRILAEYLPYQAAFQVRAYVKALPSDKVTFLEELDTHVKTYIRAYQKQAATGRDDRSNRPDPFQNGQRTQSTW